MAYIQCWTCNGNGALSHERTGKIVRCDSCGGTGCDKEKTIKHFPEWERSFPSPLPPLKSEIPTLNKN